MANYDIDKGQGHFLTFVQVHVLKSQPNVPGRRGFGMVISSSTAAKSPKNKVEFANNVDPDVAAHDNCRI